MRFVSPFVRRFCGVWGVGVGGGGGVVCVCVGGAWERSATSKTPPVPPPASNFFGKIPEQEQTEQMTVGFPSTGVYALHLFGEKCEIEFYSAQPKLVPFPGDFFRFSRPGENPGFSPLLVAVPRPKTAFVYFDMVSVHPAPILGGTPFFTSETLCFLLFQNTPKKCSLPSRHPAIFFFILRQTVNRDEGVRWENGSEGRFF